MQPILGYNMGAGHFQRVKSTLHTGIWIGVAITALGWMISEGLPDTISRMFTTDETLISLSREGFRIYFLVYPVVGCDTELFPKCRQTKTVNIPLAHTSAAVPYTIPHTVASYMGSGWCMGFNGSIRFPCIRCIAHNPMVVDETCDEQMGEN